MDSSNVGYASQLINKSYVNLGYNSIQARIKKMKELLTQRQLPEQGWDQLTIQYVLDQLALMDSNNFYAKVGVGERESRIFSSLVTRRNFFMGHGIGRSGDVMANQPKAAGSSLLLQLARCLTVSALKQLNYEFVEDVLLLPLATGMAMVMTLLTLAEMAPEKKYVIWSRIDQKTCLKAIKTANLIPIVVEEVIDGDALKCDGQSISTKIEEVGVGNVLCIVSTTSCFAPRIPDDVEGNGIIAKKYGIYHVVNNAYGIWCSKIAHSIKQCYEKSQCTAVIQSTDKNFMVPVGGSFIFTQSEELLKKISNKYPGRACASPIVDLFLTFLAMGKKTIKQMKKVRKENFKHMLELGRNFAEQHGCRILDTPSNSISISMCVEGLGLADPTDLGAILYANRVMGHRILNRSDNLTKVAGIQFHNYGTHHDQYPHLPYITFACAVGTEKQQITQFFKRLELSVKDIKKKEQKKQKKKENIKAIVESKKEEEENIQSQEKQLSYQEEKQEYLQASMNMSEQEE